MICLVKLIKRVETCGIEYRAPDGWDGSGILPLRAAGIPAEGSPAFAWIPGAVDTTDIRVIGSDVTEKLAAVAKTALQTRFSLTLQSASPTIAETLLELMTTAADGVRWHPIGPGSDGLCRLYFRGQLLASWVGGVAHGSVSHPETFPNTGTGTSQDLTWAAVSGATTPWLITTGSPHYVSANAGATSNTTYYVTTPLVDTDDNFVSATLNVEATNNTIAMIGCRGSGTNNHTRYDAFWRFAISHTRRIRAVGTDGSATTLAEDTTDPSATSLAAKVQANGSGTGAITGFIGSWNPGGLNDSSIVTGKGAVIRVDAGTNATDARVLGDFVHQDVSYSAATGWGPLLSLANNRLVNA